jgi:hypothetical protein
MNRIGRIAAHAAAEIWSADRPLRAVSLRLCNRYKDPICDQNWSVTGGQIEVIPVPEMSDTDQVAIDRDKPAPEAHPLSDQDRNAELMHEELRSVIASADFSRAPIMKRLLAFLVGETAAGRGDQLKAYSVAVDGLGRAPDYDARADSYPRVQVGRLRRMLESHYQTSRPSRGLRLTIPSGRYRVALVPDQRDEDLAEGAVSVDDTLSSWSLLLGWNTLLLVAMLLLGTVLAVHFIPWRSLAPTAPHERPVLELGAVSMARESKLGNVVRATLINGLARSNVYMLKPLRRSAAVEPGAPKPNYRLGADLVTGERPRLFLRLSQVGPDRLIWSGDVSLAGVNLDDGEAIDRALAPAIAAIGRVNGLIATHELQEYGGQKAVGYSCLLLYHRYRKERSTVELPHLEACIERSLKADPDNADLQAAASQLAIERMVSSNTDPRERPALLATAQRHAQISAMVDPYDPWTNATRARVALARGVCPQVVSFAMRAVQLQPYDPALLSDVGLYLLACNDNRAEGMIRRAITIGDDPDGRFYGPLLLLAIGQDNQAMAREALSHLAPPVIGNNGRYYLITAAGYAMIGDLGRARAAWSQLQQVNEAIARDPHSYFERLGYAAGLRAKAIEHLRRARLIAD